MKVSEVTYQDLKEFARVYHDDDDTLFRSILVGCKAFIKGKTGLTIEQMDQYDDIAIAIQILSNELYDNRTYTVENDKVNPFVKSILDMYCVNYVG